MESWFKLFGGFALVGVGIWRLSVMIRDTRNGYKDRYGNDIGIYFGAVFCIILGLVLIYQEAF